MDCQNYDLTKAHNKQITCISITSNGKYIITGSDDKTIKIWDMQTGDELRTLKGHKHGISSLKLVNNERYIISICKDHIIKVWDFNSGELQVSYISFIDNEWLAWTPDNYFNCSNGAYKYFCFIDDNKDKLEMLSYDHSIYSQKKINLKLTQYF